MFSDILVNATVSPESVNITQLFVLELVSNTRDLEDLNMCLFKLNPILTEDVLQRYESKLRELIEARVLTGDDYQLILKVLSVFNFAPWRNKHSLIISKCILLMKGSIDKLNLHEMYHLYDVSIWNYYYTFSLVFAFSWIGIFQKPRARRCAQHASTSGSTIASRNRRN